MGTPNKMPMSAESYPLTNSQMVHFRWLCSDAECAATMAKTVAELMRGAVVWWADLPLWQTVYHVQCKRLGEGAVVVLRVWPQPE